MGGKKRFLGGEKVFRGTKNFLGVLNEEKKGGLYTKKKVVKKFWGMRQKSSRGAANLRSAPGGRQPSYATVFKT